MDIIRSSGIIETLDLNGTVLVTCLKGYWPGLARLSDINKALHNKQCYWRAVAAGCSDYLDLRPSSDEIVCETDGCSEYTNLKYTYGGKLLCVECYNKLVGQQK